MASQYRIKRRIQTMQVAANSFGLIDLPRQYDYEALHLRIAGSLQVTAGATSVRAEAPCQLVPRIEVIADGKNTIYSAPFWYASLGNVIREITVTGARATTPPSGVAIATYAVEAIGIVDFQTVDGVRPKDSNFRTRGLSLLQLRLTYGAAADCFVGGTVVFSGTPTVEVSSAECVEETDDAGAFKTAPIALKKVSFQQQAFASSNSAAEFRLPAGNMIRSVTVRTDGNPTPGEPGVNVLNNLQLLSGVDVRLNMSGAGLRAMQNADFGQVLAGYYRADLLAKGGPTVNLTDLWDVTRQAEPKCVLDVTGAANVQVQVVTEEYILAAA